MATITSAQAGNWSATSTWVGGVVPGAADIAVAATGHIVAIDVDSTLNEVRQVGTGKFTLGGGRTLTANVQINAGTFTSGGTVEVTAGAGTTATIIGNVAGASSTLVNQAGVVMTGVGTLVIDGTVTGTAGSVTDNSASECAAVYTNVSSTVNVLRAVAAGGVRKYGVYAAAGGTSTIVTITGNSSGGGIPNAYGAYTAGTSASMTITGNATGGVGNGSHGALMTGTSATLVIIGNVTGGGGTSSYGAYATGISASMAITGNVSGSGGTGSHGVVIPGNLATVTITGSVASSSSNSVGVVAAGTSPSVTITGNVTGGSGANAYGVSTTGTLATLAITGNVTGGIGANAHGALTTGTSASQINSIIGTVTASTGSGAIGSHGIFNSNASGGWTIVGGSLIDSAQGDCAVYTRRFRCIPTLNTVRQHANNTGYPSGGMVTYGSLDYITNNVPIPANVRRGTVYGNNSFTGTMAIPDAASVNSGVAVGATTGIAALSLSDVAAQIGSQLITMGAF